MLKVFLWGRSWADETTDMGCFSCILQSDWEESFILATTLVYSSQIKSGHEATGTQGLDSYICAMVNIDDIQFACALGRGTTHDGEPWPRSCEGNAKNKHPVRVQRSSPHVAPKLLPFMKNNRNFYLKPIPSSNTYCLWYSSFKAVYVVFFITAVGLLQISRQHWNHYIETFSMDWGSSIMHFYRWCESQYHTPCDTMHFASVNWD